MDLDKKANQEIVKGLAGMYVSCPYSEVILDKKTTIVVSCEGSADVVCHADYWDGVKDRIHEGAKKAGREITVLDGRELFKR